MSLELDMVSNIFSEERQKVGAGSYRRGMGDYQSCTEVAEWAAEEAKRKQVSIERVVRTSVRGYFYSPASPAKERNHSFGAFAKDPGYWLEEGLKILKKKQKEKASHKSYREKPVNFDEKMNAQAPKHLQALLFGNDDEAKRAAKYYFVTEFINDWKAFLASYEKGTKEERAVLKRTIDEYTDWCSALLDQSPENETIKKAAKVLAHVRSKI